MTYDPDARRETPLALKLKQRIRREGPIRVDQYLEACLHDATHGYYSNKAAIGARGDFITAPEISQVFGELIGAWCVAVWHQMGRPSPFNLVEFGPGRGTMMRDALRAMRVRPEILAAVHLVLIESNTTLKQTQRETLSVAGVPIAWAGKLVYATDSSLPAIILANEYIDTEPVEQFVRLAGHWAVRTVGLDANTDLSFMTDSACSAYAVQELDRRFSGAKPGDVCELYSFEHDFVDALFNQPVLVSALIIDYGHTQSGPGDTLQAVRAHAPEHPLTSPGEADLTAQVDFAQVLDALRSDKIAVDGPVTQAEFLGSLGIIERASHLMAANPIKAGEIEMAVARLMAPNGMGARFKAIGLRTAGLPPLPGF